MRIGIFGGTFDPIHRTHVAIGRSALRHKALDRVLFVVASDPPHKGTADLTPADIRYAMVAAALDSEPGLEPCDLELHRDGPSYTADTVKTLRAHYPDAEFLLIIGQDSLVDLPNWYKTEDILHDVRLLVLPRPGTDAVIPPELEGRYEMLPFEQSDVSSTGVRNRLEAGDGVSDVLPPAVQRIVTEKGLYRAHH